MMHRNNVFFLVLFRYFLLMSSWSRDYPTNGTIHVCVFVWFQLFTTTSFCGFEQFASKSNGFCTSIQFGSCGHLLQCDSWTFCAFTWLRLALIRSWLAFNSLWSVSISLWAIFDILRFHSEFWNFKSFSARRGPHPMPYIYPMQIRNLDVMPVGWEKR